MAMPYNVEAVSLLSLGDDLLARVRNDKFDLLAHLHEGTPRKLVEYVDRAQDAALALLPIRRVQEAAAATTTTTKRTEHQI